MAVGSIQTAIWRGQRVILSDNASTVNYTVTVEDTQKLIYSGRAVPKPGQADTVVELFDVLAPYLKQAYIDPEYAEQAQGGIVVEAVPFSRRFLLQYTLGGVSTTQNLDMTADWSYEYVARGFLLNGGVYGNTHPFGFPFVVSARYCPAGTIRVIHRNGTVLASINDAAIGSKNISVSSQYLPPVGQDFRIVLPDNTATPYIRVENACRSRWGLYYVNINGGWDLLPIKGLVRRTDTFERSENEVAYRRTLLEEAHRRINRIDLGVQWELNTGLLTDGQSALFGKHVPSAPLAILWDNDNARSLPVSIADNEIQVGKSIITNSRRPVDYTFTVQLQQDRIRL